MTRETFLTKALEQYLRRMVCPRHMQEKPYVIKAELQALIGAILRHAPPAGCEDWWRRVEMHLDESNKSRAWPTVREIASAAQAVAPASGPRIAEERDKKSLKIMADRLNAGDPIGDGYLFGRGAVELLGSGLVNVDVMEQRQASHFREIDKTYDKPQAGAKKAFLTNRHELAMHCFRRPGK